MRAREYGVLFALALIWGASFLFIKVGVQEISPATVVAGRLTFSVITLGLIVAFRHELIQGWRRYWKLAVGAGCVESAPGGLTRLFLERPGPVRVTAQFAPGRLVSRAPRCRHATRA